MHSRLTCCLAVVVALVLAAPASAQDDLDRVQVGVPGTVTSKFPTNTSIHFNIPSGWGRTCCYDFESGAWTGPRIRYSANPEREDYSQVAWRVTFVRTNRPAAALAKAAGWGDYPQASAKARKVAHTLGGRAVGRMRAFSAVDQQQAPLAKAQAALVIELGLRVKAVILFHISDPPSNESGGGTQTVNGMSASAWNRRTAEVMLKAIEVEGSLPVSRVKVRAAGRRVTGSATDIAGHPVGQAVLTLQRRAGSRWRNVKKGMTSLRGTFSLPASPGQYRVVATQSGASARSKPVRVR